jgi:hypothetical protein
MQKIKSNLSKHSFYYFMVLGIVFNIIVHRIWLFDVGYKTFGDWLWVSNNSLSSGYGDFSIWSGVNLGEINYGLHLYPILLLLSKLFLIFGLDFNHSLVILFFIPLSIISFLSTFLLIYRITKNPLISFLCQLFLSFSIYMVALRTNHLLLGIAFSLSPFLPYFIDRYLENNKTKELILFVVTLFLILIYEPRTLFINALVLITFCLFKFCTILKSEFLLKNIKNFLLLTLIFLSLSSFLLLPYFNLNLVAENKLYERQLFGNGFYDISKAFNSFHPFWSLDKFTIFETMNVPLFLWIQVLFLVFGITLYYKKFQPGDKVYFNIFFTIWLIGVFLTKQTGIPFSGFYEWAFNNVIGFGLFRETSKFFYLSNLGFSLSISIILKYYFFSIGNMKNIFYKVVSTTTIFLLFIPQFFLIKSIYTGSLETLFINRTRPEEYVKLDALLNSDNSFKRVLWVPTISRWVSDSFYSNNISSVSFTKNYLKSDNLDSIYRYNSDIVLNQSILDSLSIKYIVIPLKDVKNDDNFFVYYGNDRDYFVNLVESNKSLEKLNEFKDISVFLNKTFKPLIYSDDFNLSFEIINSSFYKINSSTFTNESQIIFNMNYNPDWALYLVEKDKFDIYFSENNKEVSKSVLKSQDIPFNKFSLSKLAKNDIDALNSGHMELYLFFKPQFYANIGLVITKSTIVFVVTYLIFYAIIRYFRR